MSGCRPELPESVAGAGADGDALQPRATADGSLTLWSERFGEAFHSGLGAHAEAIGKFVLPAQLERFAAGTRLRVVDLCVGLGYNSAALLEAAEERGLRIDWIGLELDPRPLALALKDPGFRGLWRPSTLTALEQLHQQGHWRSPRGASRGANAGERTGTSEVKDNGNDNGSDGGRSWGSGGSWFLGDARAQLGPVLERWEGQCDLVLHDAFSPGHCPELWTVEFLGALARLLKPDGRLLTYCAAAAVRQALQLAGLELNSIAGPIGSGETGEANGSNGAAPGANGDPHRIWCAGTAASPSPFPTTDDGRDGDGGDSDCDASHSSQERGAVLRPLSAMERDHLLSRAGEPYRDPDGNADAATIRSRRAERQRLHPGESTSAWRRRWGLAR